MSHRIVKRSSSNKSPRADIWGTALNNSNLPEGYYPPPHRRYQHAPLLLNSTVTKIDNINLNTVRPDMFMRSKYSDSNNNMNEELPRGSSNTLRQGGRGYSSSKSTTVVENDGRELPGFGSLSSVKAIYTSAVPSRASTAPTSTSTSLQPQSQTPTTKHSRTSDSAGTSKSRTKMNKIPKSYDSLRERPFSTVTAVPSNSVKVELRGNLNSQMIKDVHIVMPKRRKSPSLLRPRVNTPPGTSLGGRVETEWTVNNAPRKSRSHFDSNGIATRRNNVRPRTVPLRETQANYLDPTISDEEMMMAPGGCLKRNDGENNCSNYNSRRFRQGVTFAPGTIDIERENKPKRMRMKNNRKPKFAHPICGHFLPSVAEIIEFSGPESIFSENHYTKFNKIWCSPMARVSFESVAKKNVRLKRFRSILSTLSNTHETFNDYPEERKAILMTQEILPRYISALDIALMDAEMDHVEQLLGTIASSLKVLQINLHDAYFDRNGKPKEIHHNSNDFFVNVGPVIFAINRISGDELLHNHRDLAIEPQLVKLQLELLVLTICPWDSLIFRSQLAVVPTTAGRALELLRQLKERRTYYCVRWVNDSVMHRDYMSLMKFFGFCDDAGAKNPVPLDVHRESRMFSNSMSSDHNRRPVSADSRLIKDSGIINRFTSNFSLKDSHTD